MQRQVFLQKRNIVALCFTQSPPFAHSPQRNPPFSSTSWSQSIWNGDHLLPVEASILFKGSASIKSLDWVSTAISFCSSGLARGSIPAYPTASLGAEKKISNKNIQSKIKIKNLPTIRSGLVCSGEGGSEKITYIY